MKRPVGTVFVQLRGVGLGHVFKRVEDGFHVESGGVGADGDQTRAFLSGG